MGKSSQNEMYIEEDVERGESENVQTENSKVEENGEKIMKKNLQKLHLENVGEGVIKILCWAFYCVTDGKEVEVASHQVMKCILCHDSEINIPNARTKERKGLITYYKTYGITAHIEHVDADHSIIVKFFEEEINNETIGIIERQLAKKKSNVPTNATFVFLL
jgi:hypothetical protein